MKRETSAITYTSVAHFANDGNLLIFPILINYYTALHVDFIILGFGAMIYNLISGLISPFLGRFADRLNRDGFLIFLGIAVQGAALTLFAFAFLDIKDVNVIVIAGTAVFGLGQSVYHPIGGSVLSSAFRGKSSGILLGVNSSVGSVGRSVVPLIFAALLPLLGITSSLYIIALYEIAASLLVLGGLSAFRRGRNSDRKQAKKEMRETAKTVPIIYLLMIVIFVRSIFSTGLYTFMPYYFNSILNNSNLVTEVISLAFLAPVVGQILFGYLTSAWGGKTVVTITSMFAVIAMIFLMLTTNFYLMAILLTLFAFFVFSIFPILIEYVKELTPESVSASSNSLVWGLGNTIGGAVGIGLFALLYRVLHVSLADSMWVLILIGVVSVVIIPILPRRVIISET
jgi:FSR family fosmidomycin resistance protein-like MFS transporter